MATLRRLPIGDPAIAWSRSAGAYNFALVDDPVGSPDDDATYTYASTAWAKDYFDFLTFGVPEGATITNIKLYERFKLATAGGTQHMRGLIKVDGVTHYGSIEDAWYGAYKDEVWTWTTNPETGQPWTVNDVNGVGSKPLQAFGYECLTIQTLRCTQAYIEVNGEWEEPPPLHAPLMRDVDTGKLMRDIETHKLMRAVEAYDCVACFAAGKTPKYYTLTFAGVILCPGRSWPGGVNLNQKWLLTQYDPVALPCFWRYSDVNWLIYVQFDVGEPSRTWVRAYQPPGNYYFSFYINAACYISGSAYNMYDVGDCGANVYGHHGAVLIEQGQK